MDIEKLEKLTVLKEKGILSQEEFDQAKHQILCGNTGNATINTEYNQLTVKMLNLWRYFVECITKNYAGFKGRASRQEFWGYMLFKTLVCIFGAIFLGMIGYATGNNNIELVSSVIFYIIFLFFLLPDLCVWIRRFHDAGLSGFFVIFLFLLGIMVKINAIYLGFYADADVITVACRIIMEIPKIVDGYSRGLVISFSDFIWPIITSLMFMCNLIFNLIIAFQGSEPKENRYGPIPDGILV